YQTTKTISINDVNENPTAINLSRSEERRVGKAGATVATLTADDPDGAGSGFAGPFTFALVSGAGDTDNGAFSIVGNALKISGSANFESKASYDIRLQVTDNGGLTYQTTKTISINDVNENPTAINLS